MQAMTRLFLFAVDFVMSATLQSTPKRIVIFAIVT